MSEGIDRSRQKRRNSNTTSFGDDSDHIVTTYQSWQPQPRAAPEKPSSSSLESARVRSNKCLLLKQRVLTWTVDVAQVLKVQYGWVHHWCLTRSVPMQVCGRCLVFAEQEPPLDRGASLDGFV